MPSLTHSPACLYRAIVSSREHDAELVVFFIAPREQRHQVLDALLHHAWGVDPSVDVDAYNICSEHELLEDWAVGPREDGDQRLLEIGGYKGRPLYADPDRTQFLVPPPVLARLLRAQRLTLQRRAAYLRQAQGLQAGAAA